MADEAAAAAAVSQDAGTRSMCIQRLATALSTYGDLDVTVHLDGPAPCLAVRNTKIPSLQETVTVTSPGAAMEYLWSWGKRIAGAREVRDAAHAIAYVLEARGAQLGEAVSGHGAHTCHGHG